MKKRRILAVTLHQPLPALLLAGAAPAVVRDRAPAGLEPGDFLALHAGRAVDLAAWMQAHEAARRDGSLATLPWLAKLAPPLARVDRHARARMRKHVTVALPYGAIVGVATFVAAEPCEGGHRWRLHDPVEIPPVPCVGQPDLWPLAPDLYATVRARYGYAAGFTH